MKVFIFICLVLFFYGCQTTAESNENSHAHWKCEARSAIEAEPKDEEHSVYCSTKKCAQEKALEDCHRLHKKCEVSICTQ